MEGPGISREALEKYLNRRIEELKIMKQFAQDNKFDDIAMLSHKIKGSAPTFGLENVGRLAEQLEEEAERSAKNEVSDLLAQMEREVNNAIGQMN